jgi:hypothetical protein
VVRDVLVQRSMRTPHRVAIALLVTSGLARATPYESGGKVDLAFGAYTEHVPIAVTPFHGIEPKLSIDYSSSSGNGVVGVGWRLSGGSVIELTPGLELLGFDYFLGAQYSIAGAGSLYTLDGQQLIPCGSQTSADPSPSCEPGARTAPTDASIGVVNYSTLSETYLKIEYVDAGTGEWNVWQKNGTKLVYRRQGTSKFLLRTVSDPSGNTVTYEWSVPQPNNNVQFNRLDAITYNGTVIKFYYGDRTLDETYASDYVLETMNKVLVAIDVCVNPTATSTAPCSLGAADSRRARTYAFTYRDSRGTGRPLLTSLQMFGKDAVLSSSGIVTGGTSLPAMTFSYNDVTPSYSTVEIMAVADWGAPTSRGMVDWDGDGAKDFCRIIGHDNFITCMFGNGGGVWGARGDTRVGGTAQDWGEPETRGFADWDGDGKADYCRLTCQSGCGLFQTKTWQITCSFSDGTSMTDVNLGTIPHGTDGAAGERFWVDWNGDGKTDFCRKAIDQNTPIGGPYGYYNAGLFCAISKGRSGQEHRFVGALDDYSNRHLGFRW